MLTLILFLSLFRSSISQELIVGNLQNQYGTTGQSFHKEWSNNGWNNNLDFAIYGWFKLSSQLFSNNWIVGFHFTSNDNTTWSNGSNLGDRVLTFFIQGYYLQAGTYTTQQNQPNVFNSLTYNTNDMDKWAFIYVACTQSGNTFYSYFQLASSGVVKQQIPNIIHFTSNYYQIYVGYTKYFSNYFGGQICSLYLSAGPNAYTENETTIQQLFNIQPSIALSCSFCQQNTFLLGYTCLQWCPNNYKQDTSFQQCSQCSTYTSECQACSATCRSCQFGYKNNCLDCYSSMNYSSGTCTCKNGIDNRNIFYECSNDNIAVLQANLASDSPTLTINFGVPLSNNNLSCGQIFEQSTLSKLGSTPSCTIVQTNITVALSSDSTIMETDQITLLPNILKYESNNNAINTFYWISFSQLRSIAPQIDFKFDQVQDTCHDITFNYLDIKNDANRGFYSFQWNIQTIPSLDQITQQKIDTILTTANNQQSTTLLIPKYIIPSGTSVTAIFKYTLKINISGNLQFTTYYQRYKQINMNTILGVPQPFYRYMNLQLQFQFVFLTCDQNGVSTPQEPLDIQIISSAVPSLTQTQSQLAQSIIQINLKKYQIPLNSDLDILINVSLSGDNTFVQPFKQINSPTISELLIQINGGLNGIFGYQSPLNLTGIVRDFEVQDPSSPQAINLSWSCKSLVITNGDYQCYDYLNKVVVLPQNTVSISIPASTFNPYQTILITFSGQKDTRKSSQTMTAIISEIDIPPLFIQLQELTQYQQVNINEDILVTIKYDSSLSSDVLTYAGAVLYNNKQVGIIKFDFFQVKFRIWDYFSNVTSNNPIIQVRFTAYNPSFYMPSITISDFHINIPPTQCVFTVNPTSGQALQTLFTIQMSGCTSSNSYLTYQFFYYEHNEDYQQEIIAPNNILRRQIQDQRQESQFSTILPSGDLTIMGQVMDSYLAIYNSTQQITITNFTQGEQEINAIIDQALQNQNNQQPIQSVLSLCILGEEISKNQAIYNKNSVGQRKIQLIQSILNQTNYLPNSSYLSTFSNKIISQLQLSLVNQEDNQKQNILSYINILIQNQISSMADNSNQLLNNNNIVLQNLVDSFKMLNSTTKNISPTLLTNQLALSYQICNLLSNFTLPNTGGIQLLGNLIQQDCQQITEKNLYQYVQTFQENQQNTTIYQIVYSTYTQNPYEQTAEFQNYTQEILKISPNETIIEYPVIYPSIKLINSTSRRLLQNDNINASTIFVYKFPQLNSTQTNLTCLQNLQNEWSSQNCQLVNFKGLGQQYCYCQGQKPTTITNDLKSLIQNKNLQTAFSSQGYINITNFSQFYKYALFYILSSVTLLQLGLYLYGQRLDKKQSMYQIVPEQFTQPTNNNIKNINNNLHAINQTNQIQNNQENNSNKEEFYQQQEELQKQLNKNDIQKSQETHFFSSPFMNSNLTQKNEQQQQNEKFYDQNPQNKNNVVDLIQLEQEQGNQLKYNKSSKPKKPHQIIQQIEEIQQLDSLNNEESDDILQNTDKKQDTQFIAMANTNSNFISSINIQTINLIPQQQNSNLIQFQTNNANNIKEPSIAKFEQQQTYLYNNLDKLNNKDQKEMLYAENLDQQSNCGNFIVQDQNTERKNNNNNQQQSLIQNKLPEEDQKIKEQNIIHNNLEKLYQKSFAIKIFLLHDFFNIFYTYDSEMSRSIRFNIFYLRTIHSLCLTTIFDDSYNIYQKIFISVISSLMLVTGVKIITLIHKIYIIGKKLSFIILIGLLVFYYYIILSIISGEEPSYANSKTISFILILGVDFLGISTLVSILKWSLIHLSETYFKKDNFIIIKLFDFLDINVLLQGFVL